MKLITSKEKGGIFLVVYDGGRVVEYIQSLYTGNLIPLNPEDEEPCEHEKQMFLKGYEAGRKTK